VVALGTHLTVSTFVGALLVRENATFMMYTRVYGLVWFVGEC